MKSSLKKRIKITSRGKVLRRKMGLGHNRSRKSSTQMGRKMGMTNVKHLDKKISKLK